MPAADKSAIGERARAARERLGLNQADVAERVGISNEVYGRFERGLLAPRLSTLLRVCDVLRVEPNDLLLAGSDQVPPTRNDGVPSELRKLVAILADADPITIRRVTEIARWMRPPRSRSKKSARRGKRR